MKKTFLIPFSLILFSQGMANESFFVENQSEIVSMEEMHGGCASVIEDSNNDQLVFGSNSMIERDGIEEVPYLEAFAQEDEYELVPVDGQHALESELDEHDFIQQAPVQAPQNRPQLQQRPKQNAQAPQNRPQMQQRPKQNAQAQQQAPQNRPQQQKTKTKRSSSAASASKSPSAAKAKTKRSGSATSASKPPSTAKAKTERSSPTTST